MSKLVGKRLCGQTKEAISNLLKFMTEEASNGITIPLEKVHERVAKSIGISVRTVGKIKRESKKIETKELPGFQTPDKKRNRKKTVLDLNEFQEATARRIVLNFYVDEKRSPSISELRKKFESEIGFKGGDTSVRKLLKKLGFRWSRTKSNRFILDENSVSSESESEIEGINEPPCKRTLHEDADGISFNVRTKKKKRRPAKKRRAPSESDITSEDSNEVDDENLEELDARQDAIATALDSEDTGLWDSIICKTEEVDEKLEESDPYKEEIAIAVSSEDAELCTSICKAEEVEEKFEELAAPKGKIATAVGSEDAELCASICKTEIHIYDDTIKTEPADENHLDGFDSVFGI